MSLVLPNEGLPYLLANMLRLGTPDPLPWILSLFVNYIEPDQETTFADLESASFIGYSPGTVSAANWVAPTIEDDRAVSTYTTTPKLWTCAGAPETVYGYALLTTTTNLLLVVKRFADEVELEIGGVIGVLPRIAWGTLPVV